MTRGQWVYVGARGSGGKLSVAEKLAITAECENLIASILMPRFLPEIRPTEFNYPIAIYGKWHGNKYRFITRFHGQHRRRAGGPRADVDDHYRERERRRATARQKSAEPLMSATLNFLPPDPILERRETIQRRAAKTLRRRNVTSEVFLSLLVGAFLLALVPLGSV